MQPPSGGVRSGWNGRIIKLTGYIIPMEHDAAGVTVFILAPFVGACIHVPSPPASQLVPVSTAHPYAAECPFEPVTVTGRLATARISTAEVGFTLNASKTGHFSGQVAPQVARSGLVIAAHAQVE